MAAEREPSTTGDLGILAGVEIDRRFLEATPSGILHLDCSWRILAVNAEAARILGIDRGAMLGGDARRIETRTIRDDGGPLPAAQYPAARALATGEPQPPMTIGMHRDDGTTTWTSCTAVPVRDPVTHELVGVVVTFIDITEQRRAQEALRRSEELLRSVLESAPNPIGTADRDGTLRVISRLGTGHTFEDTLGLPAWHHIVPEDQPRARDSIARVVATGVAESYEVRGTSGAQWLVRVGPRYEGGVIAGITFVAWDVTQERKLERRVAIADRMASIGELAAGVAHEVNNPLTYVLANLEWLRSTIEEPGARDRLDAALDGARRIRDVIADLRTFSRVSEEEREPLDVRGVVETALRMAQGEIRCRARVRTSYGDTPPVLASEGRLAQVFLNLVVNAAQAIPEGEIDQNEIAVATRVDERGRVVVEISDTGVGIPPARLATIFEPFVTSKPRGVGTGLGLYICRGVVTSLGGEIDVTSAPGRGSTFRVALPAATAAVATPTPPPAPHPPAERRLRVLLVDDELPILSVLAQCIEEHDVTTATSGRKAIELCRTTDFDLILCDLVMPDQTGMDVYEHLRDHLPGLERRMVFMSGGAYTERARHFLETVPNEVLDKPFTLDDVAGLMARHSRR